MVCVLLRHRNQATLTDICLFNLALSDLVFVFTLPFYAHYAVVGSWTFGDFLCHFISGSHSVGFFSSIFSMVVMTLDRYLTIVHWRKILKYRTVKMGFALSMVVWIFSVCISLPTYAFTTVKNESNHLSCTYDPENKAWNVFNVFATNIVGLVFPLIVMIACYSRIIPAVLKIRSTKKYRVVKVTISIVVVFFLFWAPHNISFFLRFLQHENVIGLDDCDSDANLKLSITVTETIAMTHCCLNPIIYAFVGQKFMKHVKQLLKKWLPGIPFLSTADLSDSIFRKSSVMSRSSDITSFSQIDDKSVM